MAQSHNTRGWGSRLGIVMAVAGSAIGLGNYLRFPGLVALYGGGAFMIPYFVSLFLFGLPLMWIEWTIGRYGGGFGHSTAPGVFHSLWQKNRFIKYFGLIGIFCPLVVFIYYIYIESWTLGYTFFSVSGTLSKVHDQGMMQAFLNGYLGIEKNQFFHTIGPAYIFFLITFLLNIGILYHGIQHGIERFCKIAMPMLFVFSILILIRVLTLGNPVAAHPEWNVGNALGFIWNPDFSVLKSAKVWLAAAGQVFFTLSVGFGAILSYASCLSKGDDVALSGLCAVSMNEVAEIIFGGTILIVSAFVFLGPLQTQEVARGGIFNLGFVTMPLLLNNLPLAQIFGCMWFGLLFLAGITSSISLATPAILFLEDEFNISRRKAVVIFGIITFMCVQLCILFFKKGVVEEFDFWGGTFCIVLFALIETVLFVWIFKMEKAWEEIHYGADITIPRIYKFIMKYITPGFLILILGGWFMEQGLGVWTLDAVPLEQKPYRFFVRILLIVLVGIIGIGIHIAWKKRKLQVAMQ